ncbi:hypothetical protein ABIB40_003744 [Pedobacter sp. UYP30]|uniref:hypothetical protein n=1 Tax=Pedobacter sp. UYP30 TaxID=1756400 RepID=UPI00339AEFF0
MKKLILVLLSCIPLTIFAQTIKTDVLVIGNSNAAFAAAAQASISGVKTILLLPNNQLQLNDFKQFFGNGVAKAFEKNAKKYLKLPDSVALPVLDAPTANAVIKYWADSSKLLSIYTNSSYSDLKRSGRGWSLKLANGRDIKSKVLIMAGDPKPLFESLKIANLSPAETDTLTYQNNVYRTTVAGIIASKPRFLSLYSLLNATENNLIYLTAGTLEIGQAAGATAAYAAFYGKKTSESNLKAIQGELLQYKLPLMPFADVKVTDTNWLAIQKIGLTGILKAEISNHQAFFRPAKEVTYAEIKQPIKEYYYKAQIWFDDHKDKPVNLKNLVDLISYVGNKAEDATLKTIKTNWNKSYGLTSTFDLERVLTRREFAEVVTQFLKPFDDVNIGKNGRVIR